VIGTSPASAQDPVAAASVTRVPNIRHVWVVLTVVAAFIGPASTPVGIPDVLWSLLRGGWMASHGTLLDSDPFTSAPHVAGPLVNVQWLADLFFHGLDALGGLPLVITGTAIVVALTYALLLAATVSASGHLRLSCIAVWLVYVPAASNLSPRPQTLSYPFFALFILAVARAEWRKDTRLLWLLPPATAVWVNVHGSFFTGFVLLGCAALGRIVSARRVDPARPYLLALGTCVLASMLNPYGPGALVYVASISDNPIIRDYVTEWAPTTVSWHEGIFFFVSIVGLGALMLKSRLRLTAVEVLVLLVFGGLAWSSVRVIVWWSLLIAPILARLLGSVVPNRVVMPSGRDRPLVNGLIIAGIFVMAAFSLPWTKTAIPILPESKRPLFGADTPVGIGDYLRTHAPPPTGNMLNSQGWGGYLEWAAWPGHRVFLDGRIELHPPQVWYDYLQITFPTTRWRALLDQYNISYLVLNTVDQADLVADLRVDAGWHLDYEDDQGVVFTRVLSSPSAGP
jgi:hypothetical protein